MTAYTDPVSSGTITGNDSYVLKITGANRNVPFNTVYFSGTWGSGTVTVEVTPDGENWFEANSGLTADGFINLQARFLEARVVMTGATSPDLDFWAL